MNDILKYVRWGLPAALALASAYLVWFAPEGLRAAVADLYGRMVHRPAEEKPPEPPEPFTKDAAKGEIEVPAAAAKTFGLEVLRLAPADVPRVLRLTGRTGLNTDRVSHVKSQFPGKILEIGPALGTLVRGPGETGGPTELAVIESADLANAKNTYIQAKVQLELDAEALRRTEELVRNNAQSVDLAGAQGDFIVATVQLELDNVNLGITRELVAKTVLAPKSLQDAEAAVKKSEAVLKSADLKLKNLRALNAEKKTLQDAQAAVKKSQAAFQAAVQNLKVYDLPQEEFDAIEKEQGRERMQYHIRSPLTGLIIEKNVTRGEITDNATNLFTIADLSQLWVWGDLYERDREKVREGQKVRVWIPARPDEPWETVIEKVNPIIDAGTRSIRIRGSLDNRDGRLLADMYANLEVVVGDGKDSLIIPAAAVVWKGGKAFVLAEVAGSRTAASARFARREVTVETVDADRLRVLSGLSTGETVVVRGALGLFNEIDQ